MILSGEDILKPLQEIGVMNDVRLSEKDANEKKTMNTHLHIIEAYSNLYTVWKNEELKSKIEGLLDIFRNHIINHRTIIFICLWMMIGM